MHQRFCSRTGGHRAANSLVELIWGRCRDGPFIRREPDDYLSSTFLKVGYHGLTVAFFTITVIALSAAFA